jgi:AcrR family transcriptional regulator
MDFLDARPEPACSRRTRASRSNEEAVTIGGASWRIQRMRLLDAMVLEAFEHGFAGVSVGSVVARAKVSRRAFYDIFDGLEACFLAVLDDGARRVTALITGALTGQPSPLDGIRAALADLLVFFGAEPELAQVLLVEATAAGPWARERREHHVAKVTSLVVEHAPDLVPARPLAGEGVMASLLGVLHTHLVAGEQAPPISLLGPMMGLVTAPYLDERTVEREIAHADQLARTLHASHSASGGCPVGTAAIPRPLLDPRARRARACLLCLAEHPGSSNRQIARAIGIGRDTHISTLLARLSRMGLLAKCAGAPGGANSWSLSASGRQVARALAQSSGEAASPPRIEPQAGGRDS